MNKRMQDNKFRIHCRKKFNLSKMHRLNKKLGKISVML